jgi:plastocyanin
MKFLLQPSALLVAGLTFAAVAGSAAAQPAPDAASVAIDNFAFGPQEISVPVGTSLTWTNREAVRHTATSDAGVWDSDILANGQAFAFTFTDAGDFAYHCDIHPSMTGVIHVAAPAPSESSVASEVEPSAEVIAAQATAPEAPAAEPEPASAPPPSAPAEPAAAPPPAPTIAPAPTVAPAPTAAPAPTVAPSPTQRPRPTGYGY